MNGVKKYSNVIMFTNGAIGDFLMVGLCADSVKKVLKESNLIIITPRNIEMLRDIFSSYLHIQILEINRRNFLRGLIFLAHTIWQKNMVVNQGVFRNPPFLLQLFARLLTLRRESTYLHFLRKEDPQKQRKREAVVFNYHLLVYENLVSLVSTGGLNVSSTIPKYHFIPDSRVLERHSLTRSLYVVVHPCAFSSSRSLPPEGWLKIFTYISNNFPNIKIVITGSKQDNLFIQKIFGTRDPATSIINLAGKISMTELANIIDGARGYIGVDTGITHLAGVLQRPSVVIGNLSNPCWLPQYNKKVVILTESKNCTCDGQKGGNCFYHIGEEKYYKCMLDIPEEVIYESIKKMLT